MFIVTETSMFVPSRRLPEPLGALLPEVKSWAKIT
jgi:hypothetical protein